MGANLSPFSCRQQYRDPVNGEVGVCELPAHHEGLHGLDPFMEVVGKGWGAKEYHVRVMGDGVALCGTRALKNAEIGGAVRGAALPALLERTTCEVCVRRLQDVAQQVEAHSGEAL